MSEVALTLTKLKPRFWSSRQNEEVSYPAAAQARLALLEQSSFWFRHRNEIIGTVVRRFPPAGPLLDAGGGNGFVSLGLKQRGISTIVLEPGNDGASVAYDRGLTVIRAVLKPGLFASDKIPAIGLFDVIEHIADDVTFLKTCRAALTPGGYVYLTVPALGVLWSSDDEFAGHYRRYSRNTLAETLSKAGFELVALSAFFSVLVFPILLFRTLPSVMGQRQVRATDDALAHYASSQIVARLMGRLLAFERALIARGRSIPVGSSLIAVARKPVGACDSMIGR